MASILVAGTVAVDEVIALPGPLVSGGHHQGSSPSRRLGGGAANTAVALARAGHEVRVVAAVGDDEQGDTLRRLLGAEGILLDALHTVRGPSSRSLVLVDPAGERTIVNVHRVVEADPPLRMLDLDADVIYVRSRRTDLGPLLDELCHRSRVVAHVPPCGPSIFPAHLLVGSASDLDVGFLDAPLDLGRRIAGDRLEWVVVTRGADGAEAIGPTGCLQVAAHRVDPVDTTGAGDAFAAGLVHGVARNYPVGRSLEIGASWGAAAVCAASSIPGDDFPPANAL